jgi:sulfur carrier protein ThiS
MSESTTPTVESTETVDEAAHATTEPTAAPATVTVSLVAVGANGPVTLVADATVGDLLAEAGLSAKDGEVLVNAGRAELDTELREGDQVVFAHKIRGGRR